MKKTTGIRVLIVDESIVESTVLMTLLSSFTTNVTTCFDYCQGLQVFTALTEINTPPDIVFLAIPDEVHPNIDEAIKLFALALQNNDPSRTIILGGDKLPPDFTRGKARDTSILYKPITRGKLLSVLNDLGIDFPKINCWEYMDCGREPGGKNVHEKGICPAAQMQEADGIHSGKLGGRSCWAISGTLCGKDAQGTFAAKIKNCLQCDFYRLVQYDEDEVFESIDSIFNRLKRRKESSDIQEKDD